MPNLSKNIDLKDFLSKFSKNTAWLFVALLAILVVFEVLEIKQSVSLILSANQAPAPVATEHTVRVDFIGYEKVIQEKSDAATFYSTSTISSNPFVSGQ